MTGDSVLGMKIAFELVSYTANYMDRVMPFCKNVPAGKLEMKKRGVGFRVVPAPIGAIRPGY